MITDLSSDTLYDKKATLQRKEGLSSTASEHAEDEQLSFRRVNRYLDVKPSLKKIDGQQINEVRASSEYEQNIVWKFFKSDIDKSNTN